MKLILHDDEGTTLEVPMTGASAAPADIVVDNCFFCEKCERTLLLSKMSAEVDTCTKCLEEEYAQKRDRE